MLGGKVRSSLRPFVSLGLLVSLLPLAPAVLRADGYTCEEAGGRRVDAAELAFLRRFHEVAVRHLPPAPAGWERQDPRPFGERGEEGRCVDASYGPLSLVVEARYRRVEGEEARQQAMVEASRKSLGSMQEDQDELEKRLKPIAARMQAAADRGDFAALEKIGREMEEASRPVQDRSQAASRELERAEAEIFRNTEALVSLSLNPGADVYADRYREHRLPGVPFVVERFADEGAPARRSTQSDSFALLGSWTRSEEENLRLVPAEGTARDRTRVLTVQVEVEAEEGRGLEWLRRVDPAALLAELGRPAGP